MRHQFDLFAPSAAEGQERAELRPARAKHGKTTGIDEAEMVKRLKESGRYRILQRLDPPPTVPDADRIAFPVWALSWTRKRPASIQRRKKSSRSARLPSVMPMTGR